MAPKRKIQEDLFSAMASILIPAAYLNDFDVTGIEERPSEWVIDLTEKEDRIPHALSAKSVVLDGYCNPISLMTQAFSLKKIYLQLHRRRWKEVGSNKHYSNDYDLHLAGMKTTKEFSDFLKEVGG